MAPRIRFAALVLLLSPASLGAPAGPAGPAKAGEPQSRTGVYSRYEQETIGLVSRQEGLSVDPEPEDKVIESIDVVALDVIEPRDPAPQALNMLHFRSRDHVIRREALLREGEPFRKVLADETARNLRRYSQLSLVIVLAARGSSPDRVRLVIITKDVWSLRLNWDAALSSGGFERLVLAPTEINLLGYQHSIGGRLELLPESYAVGLRYSIPRVVGSRVAATVDGGVILNRRSNDAEGSFGTLSVQRPLYSTRTPWALGFSAAFRNELQRRYVNASLSYFNAPSTPGRDNLPFLYRSDRATVTLSAVRSFGWALKNDVSGGVEFVRRQFSVPDAGLYDPVVVSDFRRLAVPTNDNRLSPYVQWRSYTSNFLRTLDVDTLALQEDVRLGHDVSARLYPAWSALGSSRTLLGVSLTAGYTVALGNGYARLSAASTTEHQVIDRETPSSTTYQRIADGAFGMDGRVVTPRLPIGRFIADMSLLSRYRNYLNRTSFLGGDGRLRGWPSSYLVGKDFIAYNLEYRSRPVQILSCQVGGAVFYDVGDAFNGFKNLDPHQSAGVGFRALFPQLDRVVFRGDLGFPIQRGGLPAGVAQYNFFLSFLQAFGDER